MLCDKCGKDIGETLDLQNILNDVIMSLYRELSTVDGPERYAVCAESLAKVISIYSNL